VILPPLVFPGVTYVDSRAHRQGVELVQAGSPRTLPIQLMLLYMLGHKVLMEVKNVRVLVVRSSQGILDYQLKPH
jgi:hypothetical protein